MAINDEAIPLVLRLLDQIYGLREALGEIQTAVQELPDEHREALEQRLRDVMRAHGQEP
jgi:chaperone modulatory protein CbpM